MLPALKILSLAIAKKRKQKKHSDNQVITLIFLTFDILVF